MFAAPASDGVDLSPFALGMHAQWERDAGVSLQAINEIRRAEEQSAARLLGLELVWLDFADAPYRIASDGHFLYASDAELFGPVAPRSADFWCLKLQVRSGRRSLLQAYEALFESSHLSVSATMLTTNSHSGQRVRLARASQRYFTRITPMQAGRARLSCASRRSACLRSPLSRRFRTWSGSK